MGPKLAQQADAIYRSIKRAEMEHTTLAVTTVNGKTSVGSNSGAPTSAVATVQSIANAQQWVFVYEPSKVDDAGHAEQVLYGGTHYMAEIIGIAHKDGACPECQNEFNGTGVEFSFTGKIK